MQRILGAKVFKFNDDKVIFNLKSFIDQNSKFSTLTLESLKSVFYFYLALNIIWIIMFIVKVSFKSLDSRNLKNSFHNFVNHIL